MNILKNCPFCGGEAKAKVISNNSSHTNIGFDFQIICKKCDIRYPQIYSIEIEMQEDLSINNIGEDKRLKAIDDWNSRI